MVNLLQRPIMAALGIVIVGICISLYFGYSTYITSPGAILLYTPGPGDPGQKSSSFQFGVFLGAGITSVLNISFSLITFFIGKYRINKTVLNIAKSTGMAGACLAIISVGIALL
jgi:hypothetical protein